MTLVAMVKNCVIKNVANVLSLLSIVPGIRDVLRVDQFSIGYLTFSHTFRAVVWIYVPGLSL